MKVAIIGTHGIGKTTLANHLANEARKDQKSVVIIEEVARECPFPLNKEFTVEGAEWIISTQISRELTAKAMNVDLIICDRSAYDPISYLRARKIKEKTFRSLRHYVESWIQTYDKLFFVVPGEEAPVYDGVRDTNKKFQMKVHDEFIKMMINNELPHLTALDSCEIFDSSAEVMYKYLICLCEK